MTLKRRKKCKICSKSIKHIADAEYNHYINLRNSVLRGQEPDKIHLVIDFAEKVLPPLWKISREICTFVKRLKFQAAMKAPTLSFGYQRAIGLEEKLLMEYFLSSITS